MVDAKSSIPVSSPSRRVALCVAEWSHQTTVLGWAWLRQYFLRKDQDEIFILHTGTRKHWDQGGPLCGDLETCLVGWKHGVYSLGGSLESNIREFLDQYEIDLVVVGEDFPKEGGFIERKYKKMLTESTSEWVKTHVGRPFIIIRQDSVLNQKKLKISSSDAPLSPTRRLESERWKQDMSPANAPKRKIALAYSEPEVGYHMVELARRLVLLSSDEIFLVHCTGMTRKRAVVVNHTKSLFKRVSAIGLPTGVNSPVSSGMKRESYQENLGLSAQALEDFDAHLDVVLKGDPRDKVTEFCEKEEIDLLIISSRSAGRLRKTLSGGSVSSYLINKVSCPCIVFPLKCLGFAESEEITRSMTVLSGDGTYDHLEDMQTAASSDLGQIIEDLKVQLERKDAEIATLLEEIERLKTTND